VFLDICGGTRPEQAVRMLASTITSILEKRVFGTISN
jgi:hypothetical protein